MSVSADATGDPVNSSDPSGMYTQGYCLSGSAAWGPAFSGEVCIVETQAGEAGILLTAGGGGGSPNASISINEFFSNATQISQLGGPFASGSVSVGDGPQAGGGLAIGTDPCNNTIVTAEFDGGIGVKLPLPGSFQSGLTTTLAITVHGRVADAIKLDIIGNDAIRGQLPPKAHGNIVRAVGSTIGQAWDAGINFVSGIF